MRNCKNIIAALSSLLFLSWVHIDIDEWMYGDASVRDIISAMTLEQKINMVVGTVRGADNPPYPAPGMPVRHSDGVSTNLSYGEVEGAAAFGYSIDSLGIPSITYADGPAGVRINPTRIGTEKTFHCTAFPVGTALSASWDCNMVKAVSAAIGREAVAYGVDILLAPAVNIQRNPLCGRNFEYYSEDPILAGRIGAAYVGGVQSENVGVSVKHFAANNQETLRNGVDVKISERAIREIYLKPFEIIVKESSPWTIMSSYNKINGILASENKWLLTDILRKEWGFDGVVVTDWWAEENGARQQAAGNDLLLPGSEHQFNEIHEAVTGGNLPEEILDRNIANILKMIKKTNSFNRILPSNNPNLSSNAEIAFEAGSQGMVLLRNEGKVLPLKKGSSIALFGNAGYDTYVGGTGSGNVNRKYKINIYQGIEAEGFRLSESLKRLYLNHIQEEKARLGEENFWWIPKFDEKKLDIKTVSNAVASSDAAIFVLGRMAGEGNDRTVSEGDYNLSQTEKENIKTVLSEAKRHSKKTILILNMGGIVEFDEINDFDAVLHMWLPGQEAGRCVSQILSGDETPSGKLPFTWAVRYSDYSSSTDFPLSSNSDREVKYTEDIFVGYRHFEKENIKPLYPFGYGMSYTDFTYSDFRINCTENGYEAAVRVMNTGARPGREVVQLYISYPKSAGNRPKKELKAFYKTKSLLPGESEYAVMKFTESDLAVYSEADSAWTVPYGNFTAYIASSSEDLRGKAILHISENRL